MSILTAYNLSGLTDLDAIEVVRFKREAALKKLQTAQAEYDEWNMEHGRRLAEWGEHYSKPNVSK